METRTCPEKCLEKGPLMGSEENEQVRNGVRRRVG